MTFYPLTSTVGSSFSKGAWPLKMFSNPKVNLVPVVLSKFGALEKRPSG